MPVLKIWSDDLLPLIFVSFLVASAVVSLSFCVTTFSVWLERQDPYPLDSCIRGSFVLSPVGLLFLCMATSPLPLWKLAQLCHSTSIKISLQLPRAHSPKIFMPSFKVIFRKTFLSTNTSHGPSAQLKSLCHLHLLLKYQAF